MLKGVEKRKTVSGRVHDLSVWGQIRVNVIKLYSIGASSVECCEVKRSKVHLNCDYGVGSAICFYSLQQPIDFGSEENVFLACTK
jgi:hypothetical protein